VREQPKQLPKQQICRARPARDTQLWFGRHYNPLQPEIP
jgi:hypothetical protein